MNAALPVPFRVPVILALAPTHAALVPSETVFKLAKEAMGLTKGVAVVIVLQNMGVIVAELAVYAPFPEESSNEKLVELTLVIFQVPLTAVLPVPEEIKTTSPVEYPCGKDVVQTQKQVLEFYGFKTPSDLFWHWQFTDNSLDETKSSYSKAIKVFDQTFLK